MSGPRRASTEEWRQQQVLRGKVCDTLATAAHLAAHQWHPTKFDIYRCLKTAWQARGTDTAVPWTSITGAVRPLVPSGNLYGWNDTKGLTQDAVAALLGRAARNVIERAAA